MDNQDFDMEKFYNNAVDMIRTEGWKQMVQDALFTIQQLSDVRSIKDEKDLFHRQGRIETLLFIVNFEDSVKQTYEDFLKGENNEEAV